ncbi:genetic competence negative regulator [Aciduricibacillus chroicocephali]|uniref:Genetic competence negative regulator n=1 Tax=Aciduricibacillus chroicocephali TaxID=3054939 RepID=A0ABY9KT78_9BACI|nr:genetic competence negative regulator [Bacillaceae bacterium 44XB]
MRIERVSESQFTIFLTFDDLIERGFTKEDLWQDAQSVRTLFSDMMNEASSELGFELEGMLLVQVNMMQAQGMHVVVTQKPKNLDWEDDDYVEMKVTLDESSELIFSFQEFESVIQVSGYLNALGISGGKVFFMEGLYYMKFDENDLNGENKENVIAILSEFANPSMVTSYRLEEYGKIIMANQAVKTIIEKFS